MALNKVLAALLVVPFVFFTLIVILTWSAGDTVLDADAYVDTLTEAGFFEVPYHMIREGDIPGAGGLLLTEGPLSIVSGAELEAVARELAPPEWLRAQLERAIRDLVAVSDRSELDELPSLVISLREVKARVLGVPGDRALSIVIDALPECAAGQAPLDLSSDTPVCVPPGVDLASFLGELKTLLAPLVERVPDTYRVSWQPVQRDVLGDLQRAGRVVNQLRFVLLFLIALNLALLGLIWLLAVRSPAEWLRWTGLPLLLLGLLTLFLTWLVPQTVNWALDSQALWADGELPTVLIQALDAAIQDFTLLLFRPARFIGVVLAIVGLLLTLISPVFPGQRQSVPSL
jgi:hypothetical protein